MDERKNTHWKVTEGTEQRLEEMLEKAGIEPPLSVDVGTSKLVSARSKGKGVETSAQLNAFIMVPWSRVTERTLSQNDVLHFRQGEDLVIYGSDTQRFADMFNVDARRPMANGMLNARERGAMNVLEAILSRVVPKARTEGEVLAFSVPAATNGHESDLTHHEATLRRHFEAQGYKAFAINEGLAVVFAELEQENFTGIGISFGGGLCNGTLAYLSIPAIMFSVPKGGDYIDQSVGRVLNEQPTRVKSIKEDGLDLSRPPRDKIERALHIYYEDVVESVAEALQAAISRAEKLPRTDRALPIVLAGGTAKPKGFRAMFEHALESRDLPFPISEIRIASDPLTATARGALVAAMSER